MGVPVPGSLAALDTITLLPLGETASTFPNTVASTSAMVFVLGASATSPALVPRYATLPFFANTIEFGTPGRLIAVPAVGGLLLVSIGIKVGDVPLGGANELVA